MSDGREIIMSDERSVLAREWSLVPGWARILAAVFMLAVVALLVFLLQGTRGVVGLMFLPVVIVTGPLTALWVLAIGYVSGDAPRRGMSRALWLTIVILVPNAIGFVLYFVLRDPLRKPCPHCGEPTSTTFQHCPRCGNALRPSCPRCQAPQRDGDRYCPRCGNALDESASHGDALPEGVVK